MDMHSGGRKEGDVCVSNDVCDASDSGASRAESSTHETDKSIRNNSGSVSIVNESTGITTCDSSSLDEGWTDKKTMGMGINSETGASRTDKAVLDGQRGKKMVGRMSIASHFTKSTSSDKKNNGGGGSGEELHNSGLQWSRPVSGPTGTSAANFNDVNVASEQVEVLEVSRTRPTKVEWLAMHYGISKAETVCVSSDVCDDRSSGTSSTVSNTHEGVKSSNSSEASMNSVSSFHLTKFISSNKVNSGGSVEGNVSVACDVNCDVCEASDSGASSSVSSAHSADKASSDRSGVLNIIDKSTGITSGDSNSLDEGWTDNGTMELDINSETGASGTSKGELGVQKGRNRVDRRSAASYFTKNTSSDKKSNRGVSRDMGLHNSGLQRSNTERGLLGPIEANLIVHNAYKNSSSIVIDKENNSESLSSGVRVDRLARQAGWDPPL
jgi:hypothetical protein